MVWALRATQRLRRRPAQRLWRGALWRRAPVMAPARVLQGGDCHLPHRMAGATRGGSRAQLVGVPARALTTYIGYL